MILLLILCARLNHQRTLRYQVKFIVGWQTRLVQYLRVSREDKFTSRPRDKHRHSRSADKLQFVSTKLSATRSPPAERSTGVLLKRH